MTNRKWPAARRFTMAVGFVFAAVVAQAQLIGPIIDIDFDGGTAANAGIGPDGVVTGDPGETIFSDGAFTLTDLDGADPQPSLSIPFDTSAPSPFGGGVSFDLSFDFMSDGGFGPLFQALGDTDNFDDDPPEAAGSFTVVLTETGEVGMDLWFVGGTGVLAPGVAFNDGEWHTLSLSYNAATGEASLSVDDFEAEESIVPEDGAFARPANALDRVVFGELVLNGDLIEEDFPNENQICECSFDNIFAESFPPPPPAALDIVLDAATGAISIVGTAESEPISAFSITSGSGNLNADAYTGVAGVLDSAGDGSFDPDDAYEVNELTPFGVDESDIEGDGADNGTLVAEGAAFEIGGVGFWQPLPFVDLTVTATLASGEITEAGELTILNEEMLPLVGDIAGDTVGPDNGPDGDVDIFDYLQLLAVFDQSIEDLTPFEAYLLGDIDGSEFKNLEDIIAFRTAFDEANGAGAFAEAVASLGVPEPSSLMLLAIGGAAAVALRRRTALIALAALTLGLTASDSRAQTALFNYEFDSDFSNSEGPTGAATFNELGSLLGSPPPTVAGGQASFTGNFLEVLDVPLANAADVFGGANDFTLSLDFATFGNSVGAPGNTVGTTLFAAANSDNPEESFAVYVSPEGDLEVEFIGSDGFIGCLGCGLLDGASHSLEVIYDAPDDVDEPGRMALKVDGAVIAITPETFVEFDTSQDFLVSIGGHRQRELPDGDFAFPTAFEEGVPFTLEIEGTMDNVRLTDGAEIPSELRMEVDQTTGEATLIGGEFTREIVTIEIGAEGEGEPLVVENWNSLSDQNLDPAGTGDGETWDEFNASPNQLVEGRLFGSSLLDESDVISLGAISNTQAPPDFIEAFVGAINPVTGEIENIEVSVEVVNLLGDYNDDGLVDNADYDVWVDGFGSAVEAFTGADGNGDGVIDAADYTVWRDALARGDAEEALAVPEPAGVLLASLAASLLTRKRRANR